MSDLQGLSSNILLVGFVLVGIACLYLLYSNYKKTQELEELQEQVRSLKDIFTTSQANYLELRERLLYLLQGNQQSQNITEVDIVKKNEIKNIEIDNNIPLLSTQDDNIHLESIKTIKLKEEQNLVSTVFNSNEEKKNEDDKNIKTIDINNDLDDLKDLEELENPKEENFNEDNNEDDISNNDDMNTIDLGDVEQVKEKILNSVYSFKDDNLDIEDLINDMIDNEILETQSIKTDPNNNDLNDLDIDLDEIQNHIDIDNNDSSNVDIELPTETINIDLTKTIKLDNDIDILSTLLNNKDDNITDNNYKKITVDLDYNIEQSSNKKVNDTNTKSIIIENKNDSQNDQQQDLHSMSVKQLKELAKIKKIKTVGTKQELIQALLNA